MGEVILLLQQQMLSAPPPSSPSSSSSDFVAVLIVPASALTLTAFVLGAGMSAPERVSVAVVSFDSVRRVLCACFRCRPTLTRAFPKGCHCRWLCAGVAAAHRHRVLGRYVHAGRPQRPSSLTPFTLLGALHRVLVKRVIKGAATLRRQAPQMKLGGVSAASAAAAASASASPTLSAPTSAPPPPPQTPPPVAPGSPSVSALPIVSVGVIDRGAAAAERHTMSALSSNVLLVANLLKRRLNTRNKWEIRKCTVDGAGNFTFYKSPESFKSKSLAFSSVSISGANSFDVSFGRRREDSFAFQFKQDQKDGGAELQRWVDTIRRVIDKISEDVLEQLNALQRTPGVVAPPRPLSPDGVAVPPPPSPRAPPPAGAGAGASSGKPRMALSAKEQSLARRGAMNVTSVTENEQYRELAIAVTSRPEAAPELEFLQRVACEHVLKLILPGNGPVKLSLTPPMLDFEGRKCEVGAEIMDTLTLVNRGARVLKGSASIQELSKSVQVRIEPKKFSLGSQQVVEIEVTASFGHLTTWRAVLELQFEGGVRLLVPLVGRSTSPKQIDAKQLVMGARLGGGTFASVYKATYNSMTVAVKSMINPEDFKKELDVLSVLNEHPNVVNYLGYTLRSPDESCLVLEYVELGSLDQYIAPASPPLSLLYCLRAASDAANGLSFLHTNCILHLDMKPANMLVVSLDPQSLMTIKLTDFGMSRESNSRHTIVGTFVEGTALYMAPEMMQRVQSEKADVYSLGMCLWEMLSRRSPYSDVTLSEAGLDNAAQPTTKLVSSFDLAKLKDIGASPGRLPNTVPPNVVRTIDYLMAHDRDARPTAMQAFSELMRIAMTSNASAQASTAASQFGTYRASTGGAAVVAAAAAAAAPQRPTAPTTASPAKGAPDVAPRQYATIGARAAASFVAATASKPPTPTKPPAASALLATVAPTTVAAAAAAATATATRPTANAPAPSVSPARAPPPKHSVSSVDVRAASKPSLAASPAKAVAPSVEERQDDNDDYSYDDTDEDADESSEFSGGSEEMPLPPMPLRASDMTVLDVLEKSLGIQRPDAMTRLDLARVSDLRESESTGAARVSSMVVGELPLPPLEARDSRALELPLPPLHDKMPSPLGAPPSDTVDELLTTLAIESLSPRTATLPLVSPRESTRSVSTGAFDSTLVLARGRAECQQLDCYWAGATRTDANDVLGGRKVGAFVLRPSSQSNCVALSHVQVNGSVGHAVIKLRASPIDASAVEYQLEDEAKLYPTIVALLSDHSQLDFAQAREAVAELRRRAGGS